MMSDYLSRSSSNPLLTSVEENFKKSFWSLNHGWFKEECKAAAVLRPRAEEHYVTVKLVMFQRKTFKISICSVGKQKQTEKDILIHVFLMKCGVFVVIVFIWLCHTEWGGTYDSCSITTKAMASTAPFDSTYAAATPED